MKFIASSLLFLIPQLFAYIAFIFQNTLDPAIANMTKDKLKIKLPRKNAKFLWKYLDLHKFISFLIKKELFFTRLDKFDDPIEGVRTRLLRELANSGKPIDLDSQKIREMQQRNYVNCWFGGDEESMAMWNLYSNFDSVVIKVNFDLFKCKLKQSFTEFLAINTDLELIGESISYLKLNPFDPNLSLQRFKYSALKKDIAFEHEKEYRFLIKTKTKNQPKEFYKVQINLEGLELKVITHPAMEEWKFENLNNLIGIIKENTAEVNIGVEKSAVLLRKKISIGEVSKEKLGKSS